MMRPRHGLQLRAGLGESDVQSLLAVTHALEQELQSQGRLADARITLEKVDVVPGETAEEDVVEAFDARCCQIVLVRHMALLHLFLQMPYCEREAKLLS